VQSEAETYRAGPGPAAEGESQRVHLLLSAGGVRCLSYIGALQQLQRAGYEAATVSTCSAGTFIGALYCCGLGPSELREAVLDFYAKELAGHVRWKLLRRLWSLRAWPYALHQRSGLAETFAEILSDAGLEPDPQLGDLCPPLRFSQRIGRSARVRTSAALVTAPIR
jgi:predicted acylesterase/phospholipase RssA